PHARTSASVRYSSAWELRLDTPSLHRLFSYRSKYTTAKGNWAMLGNHRISAVLLSTDLERSQAFYQDKVGLTLSPETIKNHLVFDCGSGTTLLIYGRGGGNKADHTQVRFWTSD